MSGRLRRNSEDATKEQPTVETAPSRVPKAAVTLVAAGLLVVHVAVPGAQLDAVALGLAALAVLPWLSSFLQSAELPGGWKVEFRRVRAEQQRQKNDIEALRFLLDRFLTADELKHLRKIATDGEQFMVKVDKTTKFFKEEVRRLLGLGLITRHPNKGFRSLLKDDGKHRDVRDHFRVTKQGQDYLAMLNVPLGE